MMHPDAALITQIVQDVNAYLDRKQRHDELWRQIDGHMHTSYLAERLGVSQIARMHLQAATRLMAEDLYANG